MPAPTGARITSLPFSKSYRFSTDHIGLLLGLLDAASPPMAQTPQGVRRWLRLVLNQPEDRVTLGLTMFNRGKDKTVVLVAEIFGDDCSELDLLYDEFLNYKFTVGSSPGSTVALLLKDIKEFLGKDFLIEYLTSQNEDVVRQGVTYLLSGDNGGGDEINRWICSDDSAIYNCVESSDSGASEEVASLEA